jgi:hypothetical protein
MTIRIVEGTYLSNYSCETLQLKVTLTFDGPGNLTLTRYGNTPCGQTYTVSVTGNVQSIYVEVISPPPRSLTVDLNTFSSFQWLSASFTSGATNQSYDCINGACTKKNIYSTPGLYGSLDDCQKSCGTGCSGKCVSDSELAQIEGLSSELKSKNCS